MNDYDSFLPAAVQRGPPILKRQRASKPKVKTGCITCKARRVKCDEGKPECQRCKSTGRKCEGYEDLSQRPKQKRRPRQPKTQVPALDGTVIDERALVVHTNDSPGSDRSSSGSGTARPPSLVSRMRPTFSPDSRPSVEQVRSFDFFRSFTILDLSAIHEHRMWTRTIMPAAMAEPAIYHAVVALGMLHEKLISSQPISNIKVLKQYNTAVTELTRRLSVLDDYEINKVALITCLVFTMIESLLKSPVAARKQLEYGIQILATWKPNRAQSDVLLYPARHVENGMPDSIGSTEDDELVEKFARLDLVTARFLGQPQKFERNEEMPLYFNNLGEAYHYLGFQNSAVNAFTQNKAYQMANPMTSPDVFREREAKRSVLSQRYIDWLVLFERLVSIITVPAATVQDTRIILNLRILHSLNLLTINCIHKMETAWDEFEDQFVYSIDLCRSMEETYGSTGLPTLSLDSGFTGMLVFTTMKCRDPLIRREALDLLERAMPHNSFIHSTVASKFCAKVIELEERDLGLIQSASEVPQASRFVFIYQKESADLKSAVVTGFRLTPAFQIVNEQHIISLED